MIPTPSLRTRVLIVDDVPAVRESLRYALEDQPDLEVVGEAKDGVEALERVAELAPEVIILDIFLPRLDGYAVTRYLKAQPHAPVIVLLTGRSEARVREEMQRAGGDAVVEKGEGWAVLLERMRAAMLNARGG